MTKINLPDIPEKDRTPVINMLLKIIEQQQIQIEKQTTDIASLKSEIKRLKKHKNKPKIRPSKMDDNDKHDSGKSSGKRAGSLKRKKTKKLAIHKVEIIKADDVPAGAQFKGYNRFVIQDIKIDTFNTEYKLERWKLPNGEYIVGQLPDHLKGQHFGPELRAYILYQYHHQCITQPLLLAQLKEWNVDISSGQLNRLLNENKDIFHEEKKKLLEAGLKNSNYIHVDDTGARHQGKNGYCTHIGNELFAWFESTRSKSRINFLELLRAKHCDYKLDHNALDYMLKKRLPTISRDLLFKNFGTFENIEVWELFLDTVGIMKPRHRKIATEGALVGSVLSHGFNMDLVIISDDAGQFHIFQHGLCWIHAERKINELIPMNDQHAVAIDGIRRFFWQLYADLKAYKKAPSEEWKKTISEQFDALFNTRTCFETLNQVLKRLKRNKSELLLVLERPDLPLHNNLSENDIREYVKRRKISGSTRSETGRQCRDTFASLKKTCKKLKIKFWDYLQDRIYGTNTILPLSTLISQAAQK